MQRHKLAKTASLFALLGLLLAAAVSEGSWDAQDEKFTPDSGHKALVQETG